MIFFFRGQNGRVHSRLQRKQHFLTLILTWLIPWTCNAYSYVDWWMFRTDRIKLSSSIRDYMLAHIVLTLVLWCTCYIYLQLLPLFPLPYDCFCKIKLNKFFVQLLQHLNNKYLKLYLVNDYYQLFYLLYIWF